MSHIERVGLDKLVFGHLFIECWSPYYIISDTNAGIHYSRPTCGHNPIHFQIDPLNPVVPRL